MPYRLLWDPWSERGAAYGRGTELLVDDASQKLIDFARGRHTHMAIWDAEIARHHPLPRASWMPAGDLTGWVLYWLRDGKSTDQHVRETPRR